MPKIIVAATYAQACYLCRERGWNPHQLIIVVDVEHASRRLLGLRLAEDDVLWYSSPRDAMEIEAIIRTRMVRH